VTEVIVGQKSTSWAPKYSSLHHSEFITICVHKSV